MALEVLLVTFSALVIYVIWYAETDEAEKRKKNYPPGPRSYPIFGGMINAFAKYGFLYAFNPKILLTHKSRRALKVFGRIVYGELGSLRGALVGEYDLCKEILTSPDLIGRFPDHPRFREHTLDQNIGLMWSSGEANKEMRNFTIRTLKTFGFGELKTAEAILQDELKEMTAALDKLVLEKGNLVHFHHFFKIPIFNFVWRIMGGSRCSYDDQKINKLIEAVEDCASIQIGIDPEWPFPILRHIPGLSPTRAKRPSFEACYFFFMDIMEERRKTRNFMKSQVDFIDHFLKKVEEEKSNPSTLYTDDQFMATCVDLLFAALDTTSNSIGFAILYMVNFPHVQKKVQAELDTVVGIDRIPSISDRANLRYSEATMLETLRTANIVPHNMRTAIRDTTLAGYFFPKDAAAGMNIEVAHRDKKVWGDDADEFRPERFLDENNNIVNGDKLLAFGAGKRQCIGMTMSKVIWLGYFTALLQRYSFERSPNHPAPSMIPSQGVTNTPKPFHCIVKLRNQ